MLLTLLIQQFNRWYDMVWMEKHIGEHTENIAPPRFKQ